MSCGFGGGVDFRCQRVERLDLLRLEDFEGQDAN
jgi:hypothetical protein